MTGGSGWRLQHPPTDRQSTTTAAPGSSDGPLWGARGASHYGKCHMWPFPWSLIPGQVAQVTQHVLSHIKRYLTRHVGSCMHR